MSHSRQKPKASFTDLIKRQRASEELFAVAKGKEGERDAFSAQADDQGWAIQGIAENTARFVQYEMKKNPECDVAKVLPEALKQASLGGNLQLAELSGIIKYLIKFWEHSAIVRSNTNLLLKKHTVGHYARSAVDLYLEANPRPNNELNANGVDGPISVMGGIRDEACKYVDRADQERQATAGGSFKKSR